MPPSQLKRLKASLREQGILGPQQSKKQKSKNLQNGAAKDKRIQRAAALEGIREQFNPFEVKVSARGPKFEVTTGRTSNGKTGAKGRPGVSKGLGEENRRRTLLLEMQRRNKVGGIIDRRFGENDPTMAPEDKMLERFTQEIQQRHQKSSVFDLEDDDENQIELTHMGQSLSLDGPAIRDDFDEDDLPLSDEDEREIKNLKRLRASAEDEGSDQEPDELPERKKTKQEVMKEVIAKSKLYKYERQAQKDADEDLREAIDQEMPELHALLRGDSIKPRNLSTDLQGMNPERAALLNGDRSQLNKEYDIRLRQLAQDKKANPTERTKTEEEKLAEESQRLQNMEADRLRRMRGEPQESDHDEDEADGISNPNDESEEDDNFGLGAGIKSQSVGEELGVEDEDDFIIDDDLVASGSDFELSDVDSIIASDQEDAIDDAEFIEGILTKTDQGLLDLGDLTKADIETSSNNLREDLAYTYPCPQSHTEFLSITKSISPKDVPTAVRRIRALFHPKLNSENKKKLANFTVVLIQHLVYLANQDTDIAPPFDALEALIRHVHSLAKTYPIEVANAFRSELQQFQEQRPLSPTLGDLVVLTAIGTIFPTSDHFHQVVTPAMLSIGRFLGQKVPQTLADYATGVYLSTLCLQYQRLSKRYVPELIGFLLNTLSVLAPVKPEKPQSTFHQHENNLSLHIDLYKDLEVGQMNILDTRKRNMSPLDAAKLELALLQTTLELLNVSAETWTGKEAFSEVFDPFLKFLRVLGGNNCSKLLPKSIQTTVAKSQQKLSVLLRHAELARRPLELHHHRPLAIKTSIPRFEESFDPDRHYDPDRERAEAAKLRAELKRERKGAMRELRKDANFIARESLREKKERDAAYEKKYKRLVAEIQGEEGREAKEYEREKKWRKKGKR